MSCDIAPAVPDGPVYRLGRQPDAWAWPDWAHAGREGSFDNRYDDPRGEYRVLYARSERVGALIETLSRFRPDPVLVEALDAIGGDDDAVPGPGLVPNEWIEQRCIGPANLAGQFAAIGESRSLAYLRQALGQAAQLQGVAELDASGDQGERTADVHTGDLAAVFECRTDDASGQFGGITYLSRLGDDIHNWAIFEPGGQGPSPLSGQASNAMEREDPDLALALDRLGLALVD